MELPLRLKRSIGTQSIEKGDVEGQLMYYAWDALPSCTGRFCPAFTDCSFSRKMEVADIMEQRENGVEMELPKCGIMRGYLTTITQVIFRNYMEDLTEAQLYRIGMGLIPMYRQLCRLQIEELGLHSMLYTNDKGDPKIHPLNNAIREQIIAIERLWQTIGLNKLDEVEAAKIRNAYDRMNDEAQKRIKDKAKARQA